LIEEVVVDLGMDGFVGFTVDDDESDLDSERGRRVDLRFGVVLECGNDVWRGGRVDMF
jgi:hypothetical protein